MPKKPRKTRTERAAEIGVSLNALSSWERCGVDVFDDAQVRAKIAKMRNLPPDLKPEWHPQTASTSAPEGEPIDGSIDRLVAELHACTDKHQAQTIKLKIDGLLNAYKLRAAAGEYISRADHNDLVVRTNTTFRTALVAMENELPPMLHGADMPTIQKLIGEKSHEVLSSLKEIYKQAHDDWQAEV
jgi:hypothetical protein